MLSVVSGKNIRLPGSWKSSPRGYYTCSFLASILGVVTIYNRLILQNSYQIVVDVKNFFPNLLH